MFGRKLIFNKLHENLNGWAFSKSPRLCLIRRKATPIDRNALFVEKSMRQLQGVTYLQIR